MKLPSALFFGTSGIPLSCKDRTTLNGIAQVRNLELDAMELEFVRNINITPEKAPQVRKTAEQHNVWLTCHAPYYINLNSSEIPILKASIERIAASARIAAMCGAWSVCFHPGFYQEKPKEQVYDRIKKGVKELMKMLTHEGIKIWLRPETTGKNSAFGSFQELIELSSEVEGVLPCIDFAHLHARSNGKYNSKEEIRQVLALVEKKLGKNALNNMHVHYNGIKYSEKGEINHLEFKDSDANWQEVLKAWHEFKIKGVVISESPNIEKDALLMQKYYDKL